MHSIGNAARGVLVLALFSSTVFATDIVPAPSETDPTLRLAAERQAHLDAEAAKAAWFQSCATSLALFWAPPWRRRVNAWNVARHRTAIADYDGAVTAAVNELDRLLGDAPPPLPGVSARFGIAQFYQAMHPTAFRTGRRDFDEELSRYKKWMAIAADREDQAWLRDFTSALTRTAALRVHRRFRSLPEALREKVDAARRLKTAMPRPEWLQLVMDDPEAPHDFAEE